MSVSYNLQEAGRGVILKEYVRYFEVRVQSIMQYSVHYSVHNSVQYTVQYSVQYNIGVWGVQSLMVI